MISTIVELLKGSGADAWEVSDRIEEGWEFYFIRHQLDQNRAKLVEHIHVKVYRLFDDGRFLGSASAEISPTASREEAQKTIEALLEYAALVRNPVYRLQPARPMEMNEASTDVSANARDFIQAMSQLPETATEDINSYEIFTSKVRERLITSEGIDCTCEYPSSMVEVVVNARKENKEIELYRLYQSGDCDKTQLINNLTETLQFGKDKLIAGDTPRLGKADVVFSTADSLELYRWFIAKTNTAMKARGMSDWELGKAAIEDTQGDSVTLKSVRLLPNSSRNRAWDAEGAPVRDTTIIDHGVVTCFHGQRQFAQYLGMEESFIPSNFIVEGGVASKDQLRKGSFLEVVEFSSFQVDPMNGDMAGEIRLAYWHDEDRVIPVSGGSVSGSMVELARTMRMSKEQRQYDYALIPAVTRLSGVSVTGV